METDSYDEPMTDQDPRENSGEDQTDKDETENVGEAFLAPKASFKGNLSPGTVHRVRIEAAHDSELELVCLGEDKAEEAGEMEPAAASDETSGLYE
jgi:hypothetical protein